MPFLVGAVDPGITAMGMAVVDLESGRVVRAAPVSPLDIANKECREGGATGIAKASKKKAVTPRKRRVSPNDLIGVHEVGRVGARIVRKYYPEYFLKSKGVQFVYIEAQFDGRMKDLFLCMGSAMYALNIRHHNSSMRSIRAHYGISVPSTLKWKGSAKRRAAEASRNYTKRKDLSVGVFENLLHDDDVVLLKTIARNYWKDKKFSSVKDREDKIDKCYGDLGEACLHALYPGNWAPLLRRAYIGVEEAPDNMTEAKLAKASYEEFNQVLPRAVIDGFREYYEEKKERLKKQREKTKKAKAASSSSRSSVVAAR